MASSSLYHLSQKLSVVFKREVCPDRAQIFAFQFSSDFGIGATPTIQESMFSVAWGIAFLFPSWHQSQEQTSSWHHAWVIKLQNQHCKEASTNLSLCWLKQPERSLPPLFCIHTEGREHKTGITASQQVPGIAQMRTCVSEKIWTPKAPVCLRCIHLSWSYWEVVVQRMVSCVLQEQSCKTFFVRVFQIHTFIT